MVTSEYALSITSGFPWQKAGDAELWCFLSCLLEQATDQIIEMPMICNLMTL